MKERPILWSKPMVLALVAGRKTVTRRIAKDPRKNRFGEPGDRLWGREAWATAASLDEYSPSELPKTVPIGYEADGNGVRWTDEIAGRVRSSMHMPRWASRLLHEIVSVRIERLHEITEADARAEGFSSDPVPALINGKRGTAVFFDPLAWYAALWSAINGPESWKANPLVWRVELREVKP